jgi:hypothetical protein
MCGPSGQEELLASQEGSLSTALNNAFKDRFATQTQILGQVQDALGQLRSGNFPPGYSPAIMSTLQTGVLNRVGGAVRSARQAAANAYAGAGGGAASPLMSGPQAEIQGEIASAGATKQADLLSQLDINSFDLGRQNLLARISGLQTLSGAEDPLGFASGASAANTAAFGHEKDINQQNNQMWADIAGGVTSLAKTGLGIATGGASAGLDALSGISNSQENSIGNAAASNYGDWTSSLGAPSGWVPGME